MRVWGRAVKTYVVVRRAAWRTFRELREANARSAATAALMSDDVRWLRSYVVADADRRVGTLCLFEAAGPEELRAHAAAAHLPVDEIVAVSEALVPSPERIPT
jgi:hypothetical protein